MDDYGDEMAPSAKGGAVASTPGVRRAGAKVGQASPNRTSVAGVSRAGESPARSVA